MLTQPGADEYLQSLFLQHGHTPISISKGMILDEKIKMYKYLVNLVFPPEDESQVETTSSLTPQAPTTPKVVA